MLGTPHALTVLTCQAAIVFLTIAAAGNPTSAGHWWPPFVLKLVLWLIAVRAQIKLSLANGVGMRGIVRTSRFTGVPIAAIPRPPKERADMAKREVQARFGREFGTPFAELWRTNRRQNALAVTVVQVFLLALVVVPEHSGVVWGLLVALAILVVPLSVIRRRVVVGSLRRIGPMVQRTLGSASDPYPRAYGVPADYRAWCAESGLTPYPYGPPPAQVLSVPSDEYRRASPP